MRTGNARCSCGPVPAWRDDRRRGSEGSTAAAASGVAGDGGDSKRRLRPPPRLHAAGGVLLWRARGGDRGRMENRRKTGAAPRAGRLRRERLAALDLGTNNCRLLVVEPEDGGYRVVRSFSRITRLGEGLAASGRLEEAAMARTVAALSVCARLIDTAGARRIRCVATEACRRAANGRGFVERVREATGLSLEILPQEEEARLAMLGCAPLVERDAERVLLLDIGGGSTEIFWLERGPGAGFRGRAYSLPVGVVTLSESCGDGADERAYRRMTSTVARLVEASGMPPPANGDAATIQMLGTSGTVTTLAAIHLGLRRYDRRRVDGVRVSFAALADVAERLR
ncbi:MAG TPA: hypothetical protein ENJ38_02005, partial [Rhodospirillales bacterium]|nr:hypothetical protein [Rhodospirillales bacterium]